MGLAEFVLAVWQDPERKARWFRALWLMSLAMVALGYVVIANHYRGRLGWP